MKSYAEIRDELARPIQQSVENLRRDLDEVSRAAAARETEKERLREEIQALQERKRALETPRDAIGREIAEREARIAELRKSIADAEREIVTRRDMLGDNARQDQGLEGEAQQHRSRIGSLDREIRQAREREDAARRDLGMAQARVADSHARAMRLHLDELFSFFQRYAAEASARSRWEAMHGEYEAARHREPELMRMHEERQQLGTLVNAATVPSLRALLESRLREIEEALDARFPGLRAGAPAQDPDQTFETYYWYDDEDDLTYLLLPVPVSCWNSPPQHKGDPRGPMMCRVIWAFVQATEAAVPAAECHHEEFVVLEFHGDQRDIVSEKLIELPVATARVVGLVPAPLPTELAEVMR